MHACMPDPAGCRSDNNGPRPAAHTTMWAACRDLNACHMCAACMRHTCGMSPHVAYVECMHACVRASMHAMEASTAAATLPCNLAWSLGSMQPPLVASSAVVFARAVGMPHKELLTWAVTLPPTWLEVTTRFKPCGHAAMPRLHAPPASRLCWARCWPWRLFRVLSASGRP